jgi:hypothetical protein
MNQQLHKYASNSYHVLAAPPRRVKIFPSASWLPQQSEDQVQILAEHRPADFAIHEVAAAASSEPP